MGRMRAGDGSFLSDLLTAVEHRPDLRELSHCTRLGVLTWGLFGYTGGTRMREDHGMGSPYRKGQTTSESSWQWRVTRSSGKAYLPVVESSRHGLRGSRMGELDYTGLPLTHPMTSGISLALASSTVKCT